MPVFGTAVPYPVPIAVAGISSPVSKIQVQLNNLTHTFPDDIDILLVSPAGQKMIIMSDCDGGLDVTGITLTLEDSATTFLPDFAMLTTGSFKPTDFEAAEVSFPAPAPGTPYALPGPLLGNTATLNGTFFVGSPGSLNGPWNLFIVDDSNVDSGSMVSWQITFFFADVPCLYKDTLVHVPQGKKMIKDIKAEDYVIDHEGKAVKVEYNIVLPEAKTFIGIPKNSLGKNLPSSALYIREGHPILLNGKEVLPESLKSEHSQVTELNMKKKSTIYSLCTKERTFVKMNGVDVATWGRADWEARAVQKGTRYFTQ